MLFESEKSDNWVKEFKNHWLRVSIRKQNNNNNNFSSHQKTTLITLTNIQGKFLSLPLNKKKTSYNFFQYTMAYITVKTIRDQC